MSTSFEIIEDNKKKENHMNMVKDECHKKISMLNKFKKIINNTQDKVGIKDAECSLITSKLISMSRDKVKKEKN